MEIVQLTTLRLDFAERDSFAFDDAVVGGVYAKQPDANCFVELDETRRGEILSEFNKYPANFTRESGDIDWRILMLDEQNHIWSRVYIGKRYTNAQGVLMIVDGQMMTIDRRFVDFLDADKTLNRCLI